MIVYNNDADHPDTYNVVMSTGYYQIPRLLVSANVGRKLAELKRTGVGIPLEDRLSGEENHCWADIFLTSIGVTPDLRLKPISLRAAVYTPFPALTSRKWLALRAALSMASHKICRVLAAKQWTGDRDGSSAQSAAETWRESLMSTAGIV